MAEEQRGRFGARLRHLRETAGLTQEQLAERAGLTPNAISALERGERRRPYPHTVRALARALGLSADEGEALAAAVPRRAGAPSASPPPPPTADFGELPAAPTGLIGREGDLDALAGLLGGGGGPITLIGPGGVGKTRLAVELVRKVADRYPDGAVFVDLSPLTDATLVVPAVARALGVRETPGHPLHQSLRAHLRERCLLLVLDNAEHLLDAAPDLARIGTAGDGLDLLITSRAPLRVRGEREYPVRPLALPDLSRVPTVADVEANPAVELFVERARAVLPSFDLSRTNAAAVAAICHRLDGLPLAVELAAARVRALGPTALLARLDRALPLLADGARDLPERQRTMERAIAWSHDLLDARSRALFRRLAVFAGGWTLEGAEAVGAGPGLSAEEVLELLAGLVAQSLVVAVPGEEGRYRLLETVREYALQRLAESGRCEADAARDAHASYVLALAEQAEPRLLQPGQEDWLDRLAAEHDNARAALARLAARGERERFLRLATALRYFWFVRGHFREGRGWLERALAGSEAAPAALRAKALGVVGTIAMFQGDYPAAAALKGESLALAREAGDDAQVALQLEGFALLAFRHEAYDRAAGHLEEALALLRRHGEPAPVARPLFSLVLANLGYAAYARGDLAGAAARYEEAIDLQEAMGYGWGAVQSLAGLGRVAFVRGDAPGALGHYRRSLVLAWDCGEREGVAAALAGVAGAAAALEEPERAARLLGAVEALNEALGLLVPPLERASQERAARAARSALGDAAFAAARATGRALPLARAVAEATDPDFVPAASQPAPPGSDLPAGLSSREAEVLRLVAQGLTNAEVGDRLFISPRTVNAHLRRIFDKLDVGTRSAATRFALQHGLA